jgi:hypothetical protein
VQFREIGVEGVILPRTLMSADAEKIRELARRGEAWGIWERSRGITDGNLVRETWWKPGDETW